jgi:hypothetical protein
MLLQRRMPTAVPTAETAVAQVPESLPPAPMPPAAAPASDESRRAPDTVASTA